MSIAERVIPICTSKQEIILHELIQLVGEEKNLLKKYGQQYIRISWHSDLKRHKSPGNRSWRYWYAKQRLESLLPEVGYTQACQTIHQEMGIKSRNTLNLYLKKYLAGTIGTSGTPCKY